MNTYHRGRCRQIRAGRWN